jgi:pilus assembly protein CpaE
MAKLPAVLIVDPDPDSRLDVKKQLARINLSVAGECGFGIDAVSLARQVQPDIILVSAEEPVVRPLQTIESLANALTETPIIVYSSSEGVNTIRKSMLAGARDYLPRPLNTAKLQHSVYAVLEAEEKRRMRQARQTEGLPVEGTVITVAGLKGGVGKTTISTNLAIALKKETDQSVALLDSEPNFGDVAVIMDIVDVPASQTMTEAAIHSDRLDRNSMLDYLIPHQSGVMILPSTTQPQKWRHPSPSQLQKTIGLIAQTHDYVVVDSPAGLSELTVTALEASSLILLVSSLEVASVKDAMLALDLMNSWAFPPEKVKLTINCVNSPNGAKVEDLKMVLQHDIFWRIPYDPVANACSQVGQPVLLAYPEAKISQSISELAMTISGLGARPKKFSFLSRWKQ